ncbi:MAG: hypothetical protein Ta2E_11320 [Mycoplasmoidaceae bacterium]|nr:MAG: hypothetical protein Ta2E_11320 [Mycoplasmoidaceae bacterium]
MQTNKHNNAEFKATEPASTYSNSSGPMIPFHKKKRKRKHKKEGRESGRGQAHYDLNGPKNELTDEEIDMLTCEEDPEVDFETEEDILEKKKIWGDLQSFLETTYVEQVQKEGEREAESAKVNAIESDLTSNNRAFQSPCDGCSNNTELSLGNTIKGNMIDQILSKK